MTREDNWISSKRSIPWVPEVFSRVRRGASSATGRRHQRRSRDKNFSRASLFKTWPKPGNRAWKASGTQGKRSNDHNIIATFSRRLRGIARLLAAVRETSPRSFLEADWPRRTRESQRNSSLILQLLDTHFHRCQKFKCLNVVPESRLLLLLCVLQMLKLFEPLSQRTCFMVGRFCPIIYFYEHLFLSGWIWRFHFHFF